MYRGAALRDAIDGALAEGYTKLGRIVEFLDYHPVAIEELARRNQKVTLSFFKVGNMSDARFTEKTLRTL